jgi:hypothetical protein
MSLLSALRDRLFSPELCRVAKKTHIAATIECLARTPVVVVGADLGSSVQRDAAENQIIAMVEAATEKKSFDGHVHKYVVDGQAYLPVFTDVAAAEAFCGAYVDLLGCIHAFRLFRVPGTFLRQWIADGDVIIVNSQGNHEVEIDPHRSGAIRDALTASNGSTQAEFLCLVLPMPGISRSIEFRPDAHR